MELSAITPMILTCNEQANLKDTLDRLAWARQILIVDSQSTDQTLDIASEFPHVRVVQRPFDHFADQCNFGISQIQTPWVLSLDADYKCDQAFAAELRELDDSVSGYRAEFRYGIYGYPLRASLYPARVVLYRRDCARYRRDGHAHRVSVEGEIGKIRTAILHDDWKPLSVWLGSQLKYAQSEAEKLSGASSRELGWKDRIRKCIVLAPALTPLYCLFAKGLLLDGSRGLFYSLQRTLAEMVLSLVLLDRKLRGR